MDFPSNIWRKASRTTEQGQCVEVALTNERVGVRDSKHRSGGHFEVSPQQWAIFVGYVKAGDRDLPS